MRRTILVVDDEIDIRSFLARGFRQAGYTVHTAGSGKGGLEKARHLEPDLIILDLLLPDTDGYSVCEALHGQSATANIPVLILTGLPGEMPRYAGIDAGAVGFVHKPFIWSHLLDCAQNAMANKGKPASS